jgi:acetolactate synthase-1/2/3 large subunit
MMRTAVYVLEHLHAEGVGQVFGVPGGAIDDFIVAFHDVPDVKFILTKHEQGASFMATGYAMASGIPGVCLSTTGPGAMNLASGLTAAHRNSQPVLAMTGEVPTKAWGKGAVQESTGRRTGAMEQYLVFKGITKYTSILHRADLIGDSLRRAFRIMLTGRPGPVHLAIPADLQAVEIEAEIPKNPSSFRPTEKTGGTSSQLEKAAKLLVGAKRPSILVGGGALFSNAAPELSELAVLLNAPVATTLMGKGMIPENHPLSLGVIGSFGHDVAKTFLWKNRTDIVLIVGCSLTTVTTFGWSPDFGGEKIIQVDIDPEEIGKNYPVEMGIVGDAKQVLGGMCEAVKAITRGKVIERPERVEELRKAKEETKYYDEPEMHSNAVPMKPQRAIKEIRDALEKDTIVLADCGNNLAWTEHFLPTYLPKTFLADGGHTHMGASLPMAIGVKLAKPDRKVLDIIGDGSFMMTGKEIATAVNEGIPIVCCILEDHKLGAIRDRQVLVYNNKIVATDLQNPDFVKFAESLGAYGERVEKPSDIRSAISRAFESGKPSIIDIVIDPKEIHPGMIVLSSLLK